MAMRMPVVITHEANAAANMLAGVIAAAIIAAWRGDTVIAGWATALTAIVTMTAVTARPTASATATSRALDQSAALPIAKSPDENAAVAKTVVLGRRP